MGYETLTNDLDEKKRLFDTERTREEAERKAQEAERQADLKRRDLVMDKAEATTIARRYGLA